MIDYRQSGVNIEEGYRAIGKYKAHAKRTAVPGLLSGIGGFSGMFEVPRGMRNPVMVSGTDGVGTKLDIAFRLRKYDTVGIDCVAMSVNDILCVGARPLYFLDYIACGRLDADVAADLVKGIADGCVDSGCALLGGETAEMPGFYDEGKYDIAGFCVGIAERDELVDGMKVEEGDVLIGLSSTGVHSNGFSLVRRLVPDYDAPFADGTIGEALLAPTRIYVRPVLAVLEKFRESVHAMSHITGGGFYENIPRMYVPINKARAAQGLAPLVSVIRHHSWSVPPVFDRLVQLGAAPERMFGTFNMGIGFVLAVKPESADAVLSEFNARAREFAAHDKEPLRAYRIGRVAAAAGTVSGQQDEVLFEE